MKVEVMLNLVMDILLF